MIFVANISNLRVTTDKLIANVYLGSGRNASTIIMLIDVDTAFSKVKLGLADLLLGRSL